MKEQYRMPEMDNVTMGQYATLSGLFVIANDRECMCKHQNGEHKCLRCGTLASFALHFPETYKFVTGALEAAYEPR